MKSFEQETIKAQLSDEQKALKDLESAYKKAKKDCQEKIRNLNARKKMNDPNLQTVIHQQKYQKELLKQIDGVLNDLQTNSYQSVNEFFEGSYVNGYVGSMYEFEKQGIPITTPVDPKKVVTAIQTKSKLSQSYYMKQGLTVQNIRTLKKQIALECTRGIASGKSWIEVADSLTVQRCFDISRSDAMRIVRTEGNRINQQGRLDAGDDAIKQGCDLVKQWDATLDDRTRPDHQVADGQLREWDEDFLVGGEHMKAPSIGGSAKQVINCRCQLLKRPRWALDEEELKELQDRANYFGLDKTKDFEDFKQKYLQIPANQTTTETYQQMEDRLKQMQNDLDKTKIDLNNLEFQESVGQYQEAQIKDLNNNFQDVHNLTDKDVKRLEELSSHKKEYYDLSDKYAQELQDLRGHRPHFEDFNDEDEYDKAFEEFLGRRTELRDLKQKYEDLYYKASDADAKLAEFERYKRRLERIKNGYKTHADLLSEIDALKLKRDGLNVSIEDLKNAIKAHPDYLLNYKSEIRKRLEQTSIKYVEVSKRTGSITEEEIIREIAGGDLTQGSCASVGLSYVGQKCGYDVKDFRDGLSRDFFGSKQNKIDLWDNLGIPYLTEDSAKSSLTNGKRILSKMEMGKEYYLSVGRHASVVRLNPVNGRPQYLELQSSRSNGWTDFGNVGDTLKWRFGCSSSSRYYGTAYLTDISNAQDNEEFGKVLGYINTAENEQMKGSGGTIR